MLVISAPQFLSDVQVAFVTSMQPSRRGALNSLLKLTIPVVAGASQFS